MSLTELHLHPGGELEDLLAEIQEAKEANLQKLTLYNLDMSPELAAALIDLLRVQLKRQCSSTVGDTGTSSLFTLEMLGGKGCIDRIVEVYAASIDTFGMEGNADDETISTKQKVNLELILQHSHLDGFDTSVFAALGMALDGRSRSSPLSQSQTMATPNLRLSLYEPVLSKAKIWTLAQGIQESHHLRELDLSSCTFAPLSVDRTIRFLAEGFKRNQHLVCLHLKNCKLADEQITCIMEGLRGHPSLEILNLAGNSCRSQGLIAMASALSSSKRTNDASCLPPLSIDLSDQHINKANQTFLNDTVQHAWSRYRPFTDRLATLNFAGNKLNDADLQMLVSLLFHPEGQQCSSPIQHLDLSQNQFTDQGIQCLTGAIKSYRFDAPGNCGRIWRSLNISGNRALTEKASQQLAAAMKINVVLEELLFDCHHEGNNHEASSVASSSINAIQFYVLLNKGGRKVLDQRYPAIPLSLWPLLLARVNQQADWGTDDERNPKNANINVLFHLLSQGPVLKDRRHIQNVKP